MQPRVSLDHLHMPTVSVVITTYKRPKSLLRLLGCLSDQKHTDFRDLDVVILNDGSHGYGYDLEAYKNFPFELTYAPKDRAPDDTPRLYSLKNLGVRMTTGAVVWLLDDDLYFDDHTLFIIRLHHMFLESKRPVLVTHYADNQEPHHYQNPFSFIPQPMDWDKMRTWVSFAGLSFWRRDFDAVGGIDERYDGSMGFTDLDLGLMLHNDGCQVCQIDGACCFIDDRETGSHRWRFGTERNKCLFIERWGVDIASKYLEGL